MIGWIKRLDGDNYLDAPAKVIVVNHRHLVRNIPTKFHQIKAIACNLPSSYVPAPAGTGSSQKWRKHALERKPEPQRLVKHLMLFAVYQ